MSRVVLIWIVLFWAKTAMAAPSQLRLSLMEQGSTSVGVAWTEKSGTAEAMVEYGTVSGSYTGQATGKTTAVPVVGTVSEVTLKGLKPATTYFYRAGGPAGWSQEHSFRTGPAEHASCGNLSFVAIGDSRAQDGKKAVSDTWPMLLKQIVLKKPAFVIHTGDIVEDGSEQQQWDIQLTKTAPFSATLPFNYALGNHDDGPGQGDTANFNLALHHPRAAKSLGGSGTEDYYFFTSGNAIFVALSTQTYEGGTPKFQDQASWLDKVLTQHPKRWRIVFLHHPIYTEYLFYNHAPNERGQNAALVPIFNKHHVDIVFQGHNHFYERWAPSKCQNGASAKPCPVASFDQGTVYITTGGGGAFPHLLAGGTNKARVAVSAAHHYVNVEIVDHTLKLAAIDGVGKTIDSVSIAKQPGSPDPCVAGPDGGVSDAGTSDAGTSDAGADAAEPKDLGSSTSDAMPKADASQGDSKAKNPDLGATSDPGSQQTDDGCSCTLPSGRTSSAAGPMVLGLLMLLLIFRRP